MRTKSLISHLLRFTKGWSKTHYRAVWGGLFAAYLAVIGGYAYYSFEDARCSLIGDIDERLRIGASAIAEILPADYHDRAVNKDSISEAEYLEILDNLTIFADKAGFLSIASAVVRDGKVYFTGNNSTLKERRYASWPDYFEVWKNPANGFWQAYKTGGPVFHEYHNKEGHVRSVFLRANSPGQNTYIIAVDYDISHIQELSRKEMGKSALFALISLFAALPIFGAFLWYTKAQAAWIKESEEKYRRLTEEISEWIWETDIDGNYTYVSPRVKDLLGYDPEDIIGKNAFNLMPPEEGERVGAIYQEVLKEKKAFQGLENINLHKDGRHVIMESSGSPVFDKLGNLIGYRGIDRDITEKVAAAKERKKVEAQLQHSQKMESIGLLAGGIAHDFNNMLTAITGNLSLVQNNLSEQDPNRSHIESALAGANIGQKLTQQLLVFAKGGSPLKEPKDITKLVRDTANLVTTGSNVKCAFEIKNQPLFTEIDEGQMNQVFSNLVINAIQAMPRGGTITLTSESIRVEPGDNLPLNAGDYVKISVEDQGVGISPANIDLIFDPFYTTKQKGSGLGLSTAFAIVKKHGGHINVESELEKGTRFEIYLPATQKDLKKETNTELRKHKGGGRVLVMDDQEPLLRLYTALLGSMGYSAETAPEGKRAIELYEAAMEEGRAFEAVILDLTVPDGLGGAETLVALKELDPNVTALVSSGYSNDAIMANYQQYGFIGVLKKPFTMKELGEALSKALA
jgi:PAS domain S-box-containing protein